MSQQGLTDRDLVAAKRALRRHMATLRRAVGPAERRAAGEAIARHILRELASLSIRRWALYADLVDEMPMRPLFEAIRRVSIPLFPRIEGDRLEFVPVRSWSDLRGGPYGVLQPSSGACGVRFATDDAVVLPGLAFDRAGHRMGRGGGFYDRAFGGAHARPLLIGAGYAFQLVPHVPHGAGDRSVDLIATDRGVIWPGDRV